MFKINRQWPLPIRSIEYIINDYTSNTTIELLVKYHPSWSAICILCADIYTSCFLEPLKKYWTIEICKTAMPTIRSTSKMEK